MKLAFPYFFLNHHKSGLPNKKVDGGPWPFSGDHFPDPPLSDITFLQGGLLTYSTVDYTVKYRWIFSMLHCAKLDL